MKLSPTDITHQEFQRALRGYNTREVTAFLEIVAEKYNELIQENKSLAETAQKQVGESEALRRQIQDYEKTIVELRNELLKVDHLMDSRVDSELIIQKANAEAEKILADARVRADQVKMELAFLEEQKNKVTIRLREYLESQLSLLGTLAESETTNAGSNVESETEAIETTAASATAVIAFPQLEKTQEIALQPSTDMDVFLTDTSLDEIPDEIVEEIRRDITEFNDLKTDTDTIEAKRRQVLADLDAVSKNKTTRFRKSDFQKMLGDDAFKKSEELINEIYAQLEKKRNAEGP